MSTPTTQTRCKDEVSTTLTSARADDSGFRLGLRLVMLLFLIASFWEALSVFLARKGADDSKPCLGDRSAELWLQNQAIQGTSQGDFSMRLSKKHARATGPDPG
jgi:hypothetical protein